MKELQNKVNNWHEEAMELAEMAFFAQRRNEVYNYWKLIQRALNYEKAAAKLLKGNYEIEPSRSVLYLGAVHFAINIDSFDEARRLLTEVLSGLPPDSIRTELEKLSVEIDEREKIKKRVSTIAQGYLEEQSDELDNESLNKALNAAVASAEIYFGKETLGQLFNRMILQVNLESKNLVFNADYHIFEEQEPDRKWVRELKSDWIFWNAYKKYLDEKGMASTTVGKLDKLTDDILNRIGDPARKGVWDKRGMVVGDVQSGKTSNYIGLINKAADAGFRIIIILTGLYENLRQQTQERLDEGFAGFSSNTENNSGEVIGVGKHRKKMPVHPITHSGDQGDLRTGNLKNLPLETNDYYAIAIKKNPTVLKNLLTWLHVRGEQDGDYKIIRNIPLLIIDDEADYASINVDKEFVSKINSSIRAVLALFEQSAFIGYTATPFANVFISDHNNTADKETTIGGNRFRLGKDLFPEDFIINIPPPSNYIGYNKVFNVNPKVENDKGLEMINIIDDYKTYIPDKHKLKDALPIDIPDSLKHAIDCFVLVCAIRCARGQESVHNSMLVHVSWYVNWINQVAELVNIYLSEIKNCIKYDFEGEYMSSLKLIWEKEFQGRPEIVLDKLDYEDPRIINHSWEEIQEYLSASTEKIEVRAVHGKLKGDNFENITPLNYSKYPNGLSVIAVGGNKLSRGLTLEGLSVSYFLRATKFYDTLLQMGRWFGYRPGYADLCKLFTTQTLVSWYQYIGNATEELKEQFDIMDLSERTPKNFGLKIRSAPGMLMISSAAKIKGAIDLNLSLSAQLLETYILSKDRDVLLKNLNALTELTLNIGEVSGSKRQSQAYIWEGIGFNVVDSFLKNYQTEQFNIHPNTIRGYIARQLKYGHLNNWTIVIINNSGATNNFYIGDKKVGLTFRSEVEEKDALGNIIEDEVKYRIRNSRIISPPHEYLDMDDTDERYILAKDETIKDSKAKIPPANPVGKYIRKYRGPDNALLIIYLLDPDGFKGDHGIPAVGYAMSLPEVKNDEGFPYKVNERFIEEMFGFPDEAEEDYEQEEEAV